MNNKLNYYLEDSIGEFHPFYEYSNMAVDEVVARQMVDCLVLNDLIYLRKSNEIVNGVDTVMLFHTGGNSPTVDDLSFRGQGIHLEFRMPEPSESYPLISRINCQTHYAVLPYLVKDVVNVPLNNSQFKLMQVSSTELDDDRGVYVVYVNEIE